MMCSYVLMHEIAIKCHRVQLRSTIINAQLPHQPRISPLNVIYRFQLDQLPLTSFFSRRSSHISLSGSVNPNQTCSRKLHLPTLPREPKMRGRLRSSCSSHISSSSSSSGREEQLMHAIVATAEGGPEVLKVKLVPRPVPKANEVLVSVSYVGVNRPDIEERKFGKQPPITDMEKDGIKSKYLGLECSGTISAHGEGLSKKDKQAWEIGKKVCCIVFGGAYAEYVAVPIGHLLRFSSSKISLQQAAAIPQAACTVWAELFMKTRVDETNVREKEGSRLSPGETILIHGGCSGIGIFAIQMAKYYEATVFATAGTEEKVKECKRLGADFCMDYTKVDFAEEIMKMTNRQGVDVILDCVGVDYRLRNLECLKKGGRLVQIGGCWMTCFDSYQPVQPHFSNLKCIVASLVYRTPEMKAAIVKEVQENVIPLIEDGQVKVVTSNRKVFTFKEAAQAHELKEGNHIGKVLLKPGNLP